METLDDQIKMCKDDFRSHFGMQPLFVAYAPGRINLIGEHTDYNQGLSIPCAINRWVTIGISPRTDLQVNVVSRNFKGEMNFELRVEYIPQHSWEHYVYGCIALFCQHHTVSFGFDALIEGNVPIGSGVSSSAALEVALMNGFYHLFEVAYDPLAIIKLCQQVEHQYLHVKSGLLDQYASQFSKSGQLMVLDFESLTHQYINAEIKDYVWVLCNTKVKRSLAGSKYSERVEETQKGFDTIRKSTPGIKSMREVEEKHLLLIKDLYVQKRLRHYIRENERVRKSLQALISGDIEDLGNLITSSHLSLRDDYEVSCEELDFLVEEAIATNCCLGSRMMGGGFGGCTINLVKWDQVNVFTQKIREAYFRKFNMEAEITTYQLVNGAGVIPVVKDVSYSA